MDVAVLNALKKMRKLQQEIKELDAFIAKYEELSGNKIQQDDLLAVPDSVINPHDSLSGSGKIVKRRNNIKKLLDITERLIRESGRPMTRGEIVDGMDRLNITIHSKDKAKYIGTLLWRNDTRFVAVEGEGYALPNMVIENATNESDLETQLMSEIESQDIFE